MPDRHRRHISHHDHYLYENKWDETTGKALDPKLVMAGRKKELTRCAERTVQSHDHWISTLQNGGKWPALSSALVWTLTHHSGGGKREIETMGGGGEPGVDACTLALRS